LGRARYQSDAIVCEKGFFIFIFYMFLQNYTTILKFIIFDYQPSWPTTTAMGHGGWWSNRRGPRRQDQPPWAHSDRVLQMSCATATSRLSPKTALK
jgi:hypothetical protein